MSARERIATWPTDRANRWSVKPVETLSADREIDVFELDQYQAFAFDPNNAGGRNVDLPAEEGCGGAYLVIANAADGAENLVIRNDAAGTVATVAQSEACLLFCDGTAWYPLVGANT